MTCSKELFESAREASRDALRIRDELEHLEARTVAMGSPSLEAHGRGCRADHVAGRVAALVDNSAALERRLEDDYRLIDAACEILYGRDGVSDGLAVLAPAWWADAIYYHFLALRKWEDVAAMLSYSERHVFECVRAAFDLMDAHGMCATVGGRGMAEG